MTEESSKTRGSASIMTPPTNGQRNNQPLLTHPSYPAVSQSITNVASANQRQPGASSDYIANNLQQILASLTGGDGLPGSHPSMMYRPHQTYVATEQHAKQPIADRPVQYQTVKPPMSNSHQIPQTSSSNLWNNQQPSAAQASLRHGTPANMQVNRNRQPSIAAPFLAQRLGSLGQYTPRVMQQIHMPLRTQASLMQQMNTNRQPAVVSPLQPQASLRHDTPARMQQANTIGIQRVPLRPSVQGQFQRYNPLSTLAGSSVQRQNKGAMAIKPQGFSDRINSYGQIHNPIIWHIPLRNVKSGRPGGFQKTFFSAAPLRIALSNSLVQSKQLNMLQNIPVRNRTVGHVQKPYVVSFQQPLIPKQRVNLAQPLNPLPGGPRAEVITSPLQQRQQQQQKQQSLAYKMALLDVPNAQTTISASSPAIKQVPSAQMVAITQKNAPLMRPPNTNYYVKPPYSPSVRIPLNTLHSSLSGVLPQVSTHLPQVIPQVAPFSRHYINGQHSWPWSALKNQAAPIKLTSSQSSSPLAHGRSPQRYQTTVPPYAVSPQVLLYYYFYPRTLTNPQTKINILKGQKLKGSFSQKLREQILSAAFNGKPILRYPSGTGQTQDKSTVIQTGQVQPKTAPYGAIKQLGQMPQNAPYYGLVGGPSKGPLSRGIANQLQLKQQIQAPLLQAQVNKGMKQMSYLPQQTARTSPNVEQYLNALKRQQATVKTQLPVLEDRTSQLTHGLLNRPIYIQTVPYHIYNMLQQVPALNTQSGNQRYLSKVLSDILRLRYLKQKKKKKKRGAKENKIKNR